MKFKKKSVLISSIAAVGRRRKACYRLYVYRFVSTDSHQLFVINCLIYWIRAVPFYSTSSYLIVQKQLIYEYFLREFYHLMKHCDFEKMIPYTIFATISKTIHVQYCFSKPDRYPISEHLTTLVTISKTIHDTLSVSLISILSVNI